MNGVGGGPAPWEGAGAGGQTTGTADGENPAPVEEKSKVISDLSDIPAVRDYLRRIGAEVRGMCSAVIRQKEGGYWRDLATVRFDRETGEIAVRPGFGEDLMEGVEPTDLERKLITDAAGLVRGQWPELQPLHHLTDMPPELASAAPEDRFELRDRSGLIRMVHQRTERDGERQYIPWTFWSDQQWRKVEPDGPLPLFGADKLKDHSTVFIHEGASAARAMQELVEGATREDRERLEAHPWGAQLEGAAHIGFIGGAHSVGRSDWQVLKKAGIKRAIFVNDNDACGRRAVPTIARELRGWDIVVENISVTPDRFPSGWDLADPMPVDADGEYIGEPMMSYSVPATWLTRKLPSDGPGRPAHVLRSVATELIVPIRDLGCFGFVRNGAIRQEDQLNREQAPYSDVQNSAALFWRDNTHGSVAGLTYRPDTSARIVQEGDRRNFNTYTPSPVAAEKGELTEWRQYLAYMVPSEKDREHFERWVATLIGRPDVRMAHSLLLISMRQGKGKSTLLDQVLRPLVGMSNSALVTSKAMKSGFNGWAAGKRLVVCHEIYEGRNRALAESLKSVLTDERISINEKYEREYELPNWTVIAACSNSRRAVHIDNEDRRWFIPDIDEEYLWQRARFAQFRAWLRAGGLRAIKYWAENFEGEFGGSYIKAGEHAPMTAAKLVSIEENLSEGARAAQDMAEALASDDDPGAVPYATICAEARNAMKGCQDTDTELLAVAEGAGLVRFSASDGKSQIKIDGRLRRFLINKAARDELDRLPAEEERADCERAKVREWSRSWTDYWCSQGRDM